MQSKRLLSVLVLTHLLAIFSIVECQQTLSIDNEIPPRTFEIDYDNNTFLMDKKPFQFIAGSFHYFRALPETWQRKLRTMRAAGLNAVTTYVEWSIHNPRDDFYEFTGIADIEQFVRLAEQEGLYVILRPGPYICAERDMGGFPYWLLHKYPNIKLRTFDINYIFEVTKWYQVLMSKMEKFMYGNGGPIIMVQVENEYGSFSTCDKKYQTWLRDETLKYTQGKAVLFTNDGPSMLKCGKIENVLATMDFGAGDDSSIDSFWKTLRAVEPRGPLVNAEYYPGWLTHWQEDMQRVPIEPIIKSLEKQLSDGASVNFYMFYGGTNFGFTAGANDGGPGGFNSDVTSYDYDAPMDESGQPTEKFFAIKKSISKFFPLPNVPVPEAIPRINFGTVNLKAQAVIFDPVSRKHLSTFTQKSQNTKSFEAMNQNSGFILYETALPKTSRDPASLKIAGLKDRAYVYVNRKFVGVMSRENKIYSLPISLKSTPSQLQILVENEGRINYGIANDFKGILGGVYYDSLVLVNWTMTGYPFENYEHIQDLFAVVSNEKTNQPSNRNLLSSGPTLFTGEFQVEQHKLGDTYLDPTGWGKGLAFINGFNLGRYWPVAGPQITLYIPRELLKIGENKITLLELQMAPENGQISLTDVPNLDGL